MNCLHRRLSASLSAVLVAALGAWLGSATVLAEDATPAATIEVQNLWFVELQSPPTVTGTPSRNVRAEKNAFRAAAAQAGIEYREVRSFDVLFNGFSVEVSAAHRGALAALPGVKAIWPVEVIDAPERPAGGGASPDLATAIAMTRADIVQSELGFTGAGVRVAIMDTGIDYDHADLGGDGVPRTNSEVFPTARVVAGWDFVGDDFIGPTGPPPQPNPFPDDCHSHGTHVAGIVGANGEVVGVAPDVVFGAYRVFGCDGSTTADIMLEAMEMALADNMHVLNMSIGARAQWPQYPTGAAATHLQNQGMVVVASIGNNGPGGSAPDGPYAAGAPGVGHDVIGVASHDNSHSNLPYFIVNDRNIGYVPMTFAGPTPTSGTEEIVDIGRACVVSEEDELLADPAGKVALAVRGACAFAEKAQAAIDAGAVAVVISNNAPGVFSGTLGAPLDGTTPVVGISQADGNFIRAQAAPVEMTWTDQTDFFPSPTGGLISSFSSFGMAADLTIKPDISAPGGGINSTIPLELGGHGLSSGTSMSAPHVAGAVALLLEAEPNLPASAVRARLQNSAQPTVWHGNPGLGFLDPVHRQGAGLLDIEGAILASIDVTPGKLSLGESEAGPQTRQLTLHNHGASDATLDLSLVNALSTGPKNPASFPTVGHFLGGAGAVFSPASVTVPAGQSATVDVTITAPAGPNQGQYGGYIVLSDQDNGRNYRVPFAGFIGDYQTVQVLTTAHLLEQFGLENPQLRPTLSLGPNEPVTFNPEEGEVAWVVLHRSHHLRYWEFRVLHADTLLPVHDRFTNFQQDEFVGRNITATSFTGFAWDGTRIHSAGNPNLRHALPNGDYVIELRLLKALGDPDNPDHWETWTSPVVTIARTTPQRGRGPIVPPGRGR